MPWQHNSRNPQNLRNLASSNFGIILTKFGVNCVILLGRIGNNAQPELKKYPHLHKRNPQTKIAVYLLVVANVPARREQ